MTIQELNEVIDIRKEELINNGFSYTFYRNLSTSWNKFIKYLSDNNLNYNNFTANNFLEIEKENTYYNYIVHSINAIKGLNYINSKNATSRIFKTKINYNHSNINENFINLYLNEIESYNSKRTYMEKKQEINKIITDLEQMGINDCSKINVKAINNLKQKYLEFTHFSSRKRYQWVLKDFIKFLFNNQIIEKDYSILFDKFNVSHKKLPVVWTKEEIENIDNNLMNSTPIEKRNKAITLLAIRLGIRFIDIKNLCFDNINWNNNKICFIQRKTSKYLELPLPEDVGIAILDYVKTGRPKSKDKHIFLTHNQYIEPLSDGFNIDDYLIETYKRANIDYKNKLKKGLHTFRHTLASNMLESGIPLDIISSTLGHSNTNSTKVYLGIGYNLLKECCLDIPEVLQ